MLKKIVKNSNVVKVSVVVPLVIARRELKQGSHPRYVLVATERNNITDFYLVQGRQLLWLPSRLFSSENGSTLQGKKLFPVGAKSYLLE